jgi:hypothetical protein
MLTRRKLKDEIVRLTYRVAELEERLCPCEDHDWKKVGYHFAHLVPEDCEMVYHYKCRRCGKYKEEGMF